MGGHGYKDASADATECSTKSNECKSFQSYSGNIEYACVYFQVTEGELYKIEMEIEAEMRVWIFQSKDSIK